ncbi:DUF4258 domain-containing protein [uncultured Flavobacterium sp.]|uniref:DUF4258 domain-containing protein n=1 Tax=uncultured Flavobacterium sp. TaxID=165435 RepID=UPI0025D63F92|nr:DUF4258 domain-containing protein [uncultured Flavobacterium sp.]
MKFAHRLAYYLLGVLIGGVFLVFIFKEKRTEFCYLPNCRVLKDIRAKGLNVSKEAEATLAQKWVTMEDVKMSLQYGDVDFSKSNKPNPGGGKLYIIEGKTAKDQPIVIEVVNFSDKAVLKGIKKE